VVMQIASSVSGSRGVIAQLLAMALQDVHGVLWPWEEAGALNVKALWRKLFLAGLRRGTMHDRESVRNLVIVTAFSVIGLKANAP